MNSPQSSGTMAMSMPALTPRATASPKSSSSCSRPFQSETTNPPKPISPFSRSVSRYRWPWHLSPFQLLYEAITVSTPASMAGT